MKGLKKCRTEKWTLGPAEWEYQSQDCNVKFLVNYATLKHWGFKHEGIITYDVVEMIEKEVVEYNEWPRLAWSLNVQFSVYLIGKVVQGNL
jgi:hypothetical protein